MSLVKNIDTNTLKFIESPTEARVIISPRTTWTPEPTVLPQILFADLRGDNGHEIIAFDENTNPQYTDAAIDANGHLIILADSAIYDVNNYALDNKGHLIYSFI